VTVYGSVSGVRSDGRCVPVPSRRAYVSDLLGGWERFGADQEIVSKKAPRNVHAKGLLRRKASPWATRPRIMNPTCGRSPMRGKGSSGA